MRVLSIILYVLAILATGLWVFGYVYVSALACAFSGPSGSQNCRVKPPWGLSGEDLIFMVIAPGAIVLAAWVLAIVIGRAATDRR